MGCCDDFFVLFRVVIVVIVVFFVCCIVVIFIFYWFNLEFNGIVNYIGFILICINDIINCFSLDNVLFVY